MWWKAVKIAGLVSAVLLSLVFIVILILTTRPAVLLGVSGSSLASSIVDESTGAGCEKGPNGSWTCDLDDGRYRVEVNWMGCWETEPAEPAPDQTRSTSRSGCIELGDIVRID